MQAPFSLAVRLDIGRLFNIQTFMKGPTFGEREPLSSKRAGQILGDIILTGARGPSPPAWAGQCTKKDGPECRPPELGGGAS